MCLSACMFMHGFLMCVHVSVCATMTLTVPTWEKLSDSSDGKVKVTESCEQKCTDFFFFGGTFYVSSLQQPLDRGGMSMEPTSAVLLSACLN